jgi:hypothetical protein
MPETMRILATERIDDVALRLGVMAERCKTSAIGKKLSNSLWVHVSALDALDPLLRLYEGCASRTNMLRIASNSRPEEATVVKFHTSKPKITYLFYPLVS